MIRTSKERKRLAKKIKKDADVTMRMSESTQAAAEAVGTLEEALNEAKLLIQQERESLPQLQHQLESWKVELGLLEEKDARATIRKRKRMHQDIDALQTRVDFLLSDGPERELDEKAMPFLAAKKRLEEMRAADAHLHLTNSLDNDDNEDEFADATALALPALNEALIVEEFQTCVLRRNPKVRQVRNDLCPKCKNIMLDAPHESRMVCVQCGIGVYFLDTTQAAMGYNEDVEITSFQYKRLNHFKETIARFQAKESFVVPKKVLHRIMKRLCEKNIKVEEINRTVVRKVMKELRLSTYYNHIAQICFRLTGKPPPRMDPEQEERLILCFIAIQAPFDSICPADRDNFLSYSYCQYQFCQLLGYTEFLKDITLLKGKDKLAGQDEMFKDICAILQWQFIPALPPRQSHHRLK